MDGTVAQSLALTCHCNAVIAGRDVDAFFANHSTCVFCDRVTFVSVHETSPGQFEEKMFANTPEEWFKLIKTVAAKGVRLSRTPQNDPNLPDRMSAGLVGGGGTWAMEVLLPEDRSAYWISRWEVGNQDAPDRRIWRVTYGRVAVAPTPKVGPPDLADLKSRLAEALRDIHAFSAKHNCGGFTQCFAEALTALESDGTHPRAYHTDLAPEGFLPDEALTLLDAGQRAWVFGGMGSWNDMGFNGEDQTEYERVSERLFQLLGESLSAGANATFYRR